MLDENYIVTPAIKTDQLMLTDQSIINISGYTFFGHELRTTLNRVRDQNCEALVAQVLELEINQLELKTKLETLTEKLANFEKWLDV
jgi:hypothetical protein